MAKEIETVLAVEGMTCGSCVRHVDQALKELEGVAEVEVTLRTGKVRIRHNAQDASVPALIEALRDAGYPAAPAGT